MDKSVGKKILLLGCVSAMSSKHITDLKLHPEISEVKSIDLPDVEDMDFAEVVKGKLDLVVIFASALVKRPGLVEEVIKAKTTDKTIDKIIRLKGSQQGQIKSEDYTVIPVGHRRLDQHVFKELGLKSECSQVPDFR